MIGPHEGKELDLMLAGKKPLAAFGDIIPEDGIIAEEIIPEIAFAPYVEQGRILRFSQDTPSIKESEVMRHVCFTLPDQEWRARTYLWLREQSWTGNMPNDTHCDVIIGRLLGYDEESIQQFIQQF